MAFFFLPLTTNQGQHLAAHLRSAGSDVLLEGYLWWHIAFFFVPLPAVSHCQQCPIASSVPLPAVSHCQQCPIASSVPLPAVSLPFASSGIAPKQCPFPLPTCGIAPKQCGIVPKQCPYPLPAKRLSTSSGVACTSSGVARTAGATFLARATSILAWRVPPVARHVGKAVAYLQWHGI